MYYVHEQGVGTGCEPEEGRGMGGQLQGGLAMMTAERRPEDGRELRRGLGTGLEPIKRRLLVDVGKMGTEMAPRRDGVMARITLCRSLITAVEVG